MGKVQFQVDGLDSNLPSIFNQDVTFDGNVDAASISIGGTDILGVIPPGPAYSTDAPVSPTVGQVWIDSDSSVTAYDMSQYALSDSASLTGIPTAPTASTGTNTTQVATTAFVASAISNISVSSVNPVFSYTGTLTTYVGLSRYYFDSSKTISQIRASVGTAPTGANLIVTVYKNGTSIGTTSITAGSFTGTSTPGTSVASGDYVTVSITQVGSTVAGTDLTVSLTVV